MLEQLVALAKLSDIDAEALRTETELREIPARIESLQGDVKKLGELLAAEKAGLADADRLLGAQDEELANQAQSLARSKSKGARARNMREVDAVERELETIRRLMKERETERETLKEAIAKRRVSVEKHEQELGELEGYLAQEKQAADARVEELTKQRDEVLKGRSEIAAKLPSDLMRRYDLIRSKRQGIGVAAIKDSTCSGCFVILAPQQVIAISRAQEIAQCPRCQRILYSMEAIAAHEQAKSA